MSTEGTEDKKGIMLVNSSGVKLKCPEFSGKEVDYKVWRDKVEDWLHLSKKDVNMQGLIIKQGLDGKAYEAVMTVDKEVLRGPTGGEAVLKKLDELYVKEKIWDDYDRCMSYLHIRRKKRECVRDFLVRYELMALECKNTGESEITGRMKATHLLDSANLTESETFMVISACGTGELEFETLRKIMKRMFDNSEREKLGAEENWVETGARRKDFKREIQSDSRGGNSDSKKNPVNRYGVVTKCVVCASEFHWANKCPKSFQNRTKKDSGQEGKAGVFDKEEESRIRNVYASSEIDKEYWGEIEAILDTGCKSSLIGQF